MKKIVYDPKVLDGKPIFAGTRISVELILDLLSQGHSTNNIVKEYPRLQKEDITEAIQFAANRLKEERTYPVQV